MIFFALAFKAISDCKTFSLCCQLLFPKLSLHRKRLESFPLSFSLSPFLMKAQFRSDIALKGLLSKFIRPTGTDHSFQKAQSFTADNCKVNHPMLFKMLICLGLTYYTKLHCIQASSEVIPVAYMMLATVLLLEQTRAANSPQPVPLADAKLSGMPFTLKASPTAAMG